MPAGSDQAYVYALKLLARRELAEAQLRTRLARQQFDNDDIESALTRLRGERAVDDRRTALACARTQVRLKHRGRSRVVHEIEALGISRDIAREAAAVVFAEVDEPALLERALSRRLQRAGSLADPAIFRRVLRSLVAQGFDPGAVTTLLRRRAKDAESL